MAWNIHWQCCFKSFGGTQYAVNIYEQNYSGSIVQLTGAAEPFVTQEDDNDDIYVPIRKQTGYLRIVDTDGTLLESIMPKNNTEKMVRLYAGSYNNGTFTPNSAPAGTSTQPHAKWQGFLCAQAYTQPWDNGARVLEFPVKSCLAALEDVTASVSQLYGVVYVAQAFVYAFSALNCTPSKMILSTDVSEIENNVFKLGINTAPCFQSQEVNNDNETSYEVLGNSYYDILSSICLLYGMVLRENGDAIHFAQYDAPGSFIEGWVYPWADFVNYAFDAAGYFSPTPVSLSLLPLLPALTFKGSDNTFGFLQGAKRVAVELNLFYGNDSFTTPPVIEDSSPLYVRETYDSAGNPHNFYAQPHPFVDGSGAIATYHGYYRRTDAGAQSYSDMLAHSIINGYGANPYVDANTLLVTGAMPVRYFYQREATDAIKLQEGLLIQGQYSYAGLSAPIPSYCFSLSSRTQIYCQKGYLNITFTIESFTWNTTLGKLLYGNETTSAYPYDTYTNIAISIGNYWWDSTGGQWVTGGTALDHYFRVQAQNGNIVSNKTTEMDVDSNNGYFIPVNNMTGIVTLFILNNVNVTTNSYTEISYAHIFSGISVAYLPSRTFVESSKKSNNYLMNLQSGFSGEKQILLTYGTFNNNISSPSFVLSNGAIIQRFGYWLNASSTFVDRPEMRLLARMAAQFSQVRRTLTAIIESGIELMLTRYQNNGRKFFGIKTNTNWRDDIQEVKFIEVT